MLTKNPYSRGIVDASSVFIVLGWIGLWFLWPSFGAWYAPRKNLPAPRVSLVAGASKDYVLPFPIIKREDGMAHQDDEAGMLGNLLGQPERQPRYLDRNSGAGKAAAGMEKAEPLLVEANPYRPIWKEAQVFPSGQETREMRLLSKRSGALVKNGFEVPGFTEEEMKRFDKAWEVVVYVEVNGSGQPEHVILETGCEDSKINSTVVKAMYRGKIPKLGAACAGRVTLSYGLP